MKSINIFSKGLNISFSPYLMGLKLFKSLCRFIVKLSTKLISTTTKMLLLNFTHPNFVVS